jgi:uncharacterized membrane protein YhaH (DUF805 family)
MKKEEFPTFLNEQPTIIFGRTGRELLVITIGLACGYLTWVSLGSFIGGHVLASNIAKGVIVAAILVLAVFVSFFKVATRPLEEWAFVWLFYAIIPKIYLYVPEEVTMLVDQTTDKDNLVKGKKSDDDDDFGDDY